jgi:hypothetical protein
MKDETVESAIGKINNVYQSLIIGSFYFCHCYNAITIRRDGQPVRIDDD